MTQMEDDPDKKLKF